MNYSRLLIGFCVAGIIFTGLFYALQSQYQLFVSLVNPYENLTTLSRAQIKEDSEETQIIKTINGEIVHVYPGAKFIATEKTREVDDGNVHLSAVLIPQKALIPFLPSEKVLRKVKKEGAAVESNEWIKSVLKIENDARVLESETDDLSSLLADTSNTGGKSVSFEDIPLGIGQVRVGKILVEYPYAATYISRDKEAKKTKVYAIGGGVKIFYEGARQPFILPAGNEVTIYDALVNKSTGQLYYTKLQKDFRQKDFRLTLPTSTQGDVPELSSPQREMQLAWQEQERWRQKMKDYAFSAHRTLVPSGAQSFLGPTFKFVNRWQGRLSIGWSKKREDQKTFNETITPLVQFIIASQVSNKSDVNKIHEVYKKITKKEWIDLLKRNPDLAEAWYPFEYSYQAAVRNISQSDKRFVMYDFWNNTNIVENMRQVQILFLDSQLFYSLGRQVSTKSFLTNIDRDFRDFAVPEGERDTLSNMRRVLAIMLKESSFLQSYEIFDLYRNAAMREVALLEEGTEESQEVRLEIARDSLYYLNMFIDEEENLNSANIFYELYRAMNVEGIKASLNREIFSEEETDIVNFIGYFGTSQITREGIKQRKAMLLKQAEIDIGIDLPKEKIDVEVPKGPNFIDDKEKLKELFLKYEMNTKRLKSIFKEDKTIIKFTNLGYEGQNIRGVFDIQFQRFSEIESQIIDKKNIRAGNFDSVILKIDLYNKEQKRLDELKNKKKNNGIYISQNDSDSASWRQYVLDTLKAYGITTKYPDILVTNEARTHFKVEEAKIEGFGPQLAFEYDADNQRISKVKIGTGRKALVLKQTFGVKSARSNIVKIYKAKTEKTNQ